MIWSIECECNILSEYFSAISTVAQEAYITVDNDYITSTTMNVSNTVMASCKTYVPVTIDNSPSRIATEVGKLSSTIPTTGSMKLMYNGDNLIAQIGRTKYKFDIFAPGAVRELNKIPNVTGETVIINGVQPKDLYDSLNKIVAYNSNKSTTINKVVFDLSDNVLHVHDFNDNVNTQLECPAEFPDMSVTVSTDLIFTIMAFVKKYIDTPLTIKMKDESFPLILECDSRYRYLIAPMVTVE